MKLLSKFLEYISNSNTNSNEHKPIYQQKVAAECLIYGRGYVVELYGSPYKGRSHKYISVYFPKIDKKVTYLSDGRLDKDANKTLKYIKNA